MVGASVGHLPVRRPLVVVRGWVAVGDASGGGGGAFGWVVGRPVGDHRRGRHQIAQASRLQEFAQFFGSGPEAVLQHDAELHLRGGLLAGPQIRERDLIAFFVAAGFSPRPNPQHLTEWRCVLF